MLCTMCKHGETESGLVTVPLVRGETVIVVKNVPAEVCRNCGEYYLSVETSDLLADLMDDAEKRGAEIEIVKYAA